MFPWKLARAWYWAARKWRVRFQSLVFIFLIFNSCKRFLFKLNTTSKALQTLRTLICSVWLSCLKRTTFSVLRHTANFSRILIGVHSKWRVNLWKCKPKLHWLNFLLLEYQTIWSTTGQLLQFLTEFAYHVYFIGGTQFWALRRLSKYYASVKPAVM